MSVTGVPDPIIQVPPTVGMADPNPETIPDPTGQQGVGMPDDTTVQDLYPEDPGVVQAEAVDVADPTGAGTVEADAAVADVGTPGQATDSSGRITDILDTGQGGIDAEETGLTDEQRVDMELARILEQDSPLMQRARQEAAQAANRRGLQNTSMAMGMAEGALVDRALPMAAQNAQQALQREMENTENRQEASMFTAEQQNRLTELEAQLGQDLNIFNAEQLNEAERLGAQLRTAIEQGNAKAYNDAAMQLAQLQRDAEAQQADIDFKQNQAVADARNALNAQIMDNITQINKQFLTNMGAADVAQINGTYNVLIQTNATAGTIWNGALAAMGQLMDDPDMTPAQVAEGLKQIQIMLEGSMNMIAEINDYDWGGEVGGIVPGGDTGGPGTGGTNMCFEAGTCFRMADGSLKKVEDIKLRDEMAVGGKVDALMVGDGLGEEWFDVDGVHVTGSHVMKKDNEEWMFIKDAGYPRIETIDTLYSVINEGHRLIGENGQIFLDFGDEAYDAYGGTEWDEWLIDSLNGETDVTFVEWEKGRVAA